MEVEMKMLRKYDHPNMDGFFCPICKTSSDFPVVLVPIPGTESGNLVEAEQIHVDCYKLICRMNGVEANVK